MSTESLPTLPNLFLKISNDLTVDEQASDFEDGTVGIRNATIYDSVTRRVTDFQNGQLTLSRFPSNSPSGGAEPYEVVERGYERSTTDFSSGTIIIYQNDGLGTITEVIPTIETR